MSRARLTFSTAVLVTPSRSERIPPTLCALTALALIALTAAAAAPAVAAPGGPSGRVLVLDFHRDPLDLSGAGPALFVDGPGASAFAFDPGVAPAYPGDAAGSLVASYDAAHATSRASAPLGGVYTALDDFTFGAVITIRSDGYHADPFGFHPITFSLLNSATTGFDRSGDPSDFRSDTFDNLEFAWFPQVSPLFGGPFLSPGVFGSAAGDDAFADFAFASAQVDIERDVPHLITLEHHAADRTLVVALYRIVGSAMLEPVPGGRVTVDLSGLDGFAVDSIAVTAYEDGFNVYSPSGESLRADLDYHRLFFMEGTPRTPGDLRAILGRARGRLGAPAPRPAAARALSGSGGRRAPAFDRGGEEPSGRPRP